MERRLRLLVLHILALFLHSKSDTATDVEDFCVDRFCIKDRVHVRCNNDGSFSKNCLGEPKLVNLRKYKQLIMDEHNYYRNLIASGSVAPFESAARMPAIMQWDDELQVNAEYNVKSCVFAHDQCRSTAKFKYAGQNIYTDRTTRLNTSATSTIRQAVNMWYDEYKAATPQLLQHFNKTIPQTGHFTLLINDRITAMGCAFLSVLELGTPNRLFIIFTCDYASQNIVGFPSYKTGPAASLCKSVNVKYPALCNNDTAIDPNGINWYYN